MNYEIKRCDRQRAIRIFQKVAIRTGPESSQTLSSLDYECITENTTNRLGKTYIFCLENVFFEIPLKSFFLFTALGRINRKEEVTNVPVCETDRKSIRFFFPIQSVLTELVKYVF